MSPAERTASRLAWPLCALVLATLFSFVKFNGLHEVAETVAVFLVSMCAATRVLFTQAYRPIKIISATLLTVLWVNLLLIAATRYHTNPSLTLLLSVTEWLRIVTLPALLWSASVPSGIARFDRAARRLRWAATAWVACYLAIPLSLRLVLGSTLPQTPMCAMMLVPLVVFLAAFVTFPRSIDESTSCVKCGFDLAGLPTPVCPECGRPFSHSIPPSEAAASVSETNKPGLRPAVLQATLAAMLTLLTIYLTPGVAPAYKPAWRLLQEGTVRQTKPWRRRDAARIAQSELKRRIEAGSLSSEAASRVVQRILTIQPDAALSIGEWPAVFVAAWDAGHAGDDARRTFVWQSILIHVELPARVREQQPLPMALSTEWRGPPNPGTELIPGDQLLTVMMAEPISMRLNGREVLSRPDPSHPPKRWSSGGSRVIGSSPLRTRNQA